MATKREEYIAKLKTQLDQWNAEMAKWESQAAQAQAGMRAEYEKQLAAIRLHQNQAREQLRKVQAASGERDREYGEPHGVRSGSAEVRQAGRGEAHGSGGAAVPAGAPESDETLTHPRCVFQVLKRHFARYTPEAVERACGVPPETLAPGQA